jgi:hypothetical protein
MSRSDLDTDTSVTTHRHTVRVARSKGAFSGFLLVLLGAWGALVPFIGPYFDYKWQFTDTWHWTDARGWLEVLPGVAVGLGGLLLLVSVNRIVGSLGGWLAAAGGAWFVVGPTLASTLDIGSIGNPLSTSDDGRALAWIGYFYGLGAVIIFLAAFALGRMAVVGLRDVRAADQHALALAAEREEREAAAGAAAERDAAARETEAREAEAREAEAREAAERETAAREAAERDAAEQETAERDAQPVASYSSESRRYPDPAIPVRSREDQAGPTRALDPRAESTDGRTDEDRTRE